ncbi:MAG: 30S ribosome-binding factor RbfA, partial [Rhodothermia bacterium]
MSIRTERVARLVQREVAGLLNTTFHDSRHLMATVTGVRVTRDLSIAHVYVSCLGETIESRQKALDSLVELTPRVRNELAGRIRHQVRHIPELRFVLDESLTEAARIEELLDAARRERQERGDV